MSRLMIFFLKELPEADPIGFERGLDANGMGSDEPSCNGRYRPAHQDFECGMN